jgi:predicted kinase
MDIIILIGLQASGKSTFYRAHFADTHEHISKDLLSRRKSKQESETGGTHRKGIPGTAICCR